MFKAFAAAATIIAAVLFTASPPAQAGGLQAGGLAVAHAWARATPGRSTIGVVYLTISSPTADRLTGAAAASVAKEAQLHSVTMNGSIMKMRQVAAIAVPAGKPVMLKPGGYHIMLIGLKQPLKQGESFPLSLTFAKAGARLVKVAVQGVGAMAPMNAKMNTKTNTH